MGENGFVRVWRELCPKHKADRHCDYGCVAILDSSQTFWIIFKTWLTNHQRFTSLLVTCYVLKTKSNGQFPPWNRVMMAIYRNFRTMYFNLGRKSWPFYLSKLYTKSRKMGMLDDLKHVHSHLLVKQGCVRLSHQVPHMTHPIDSVYEVPHVR